MHQYIELKHSLPTKWFEVQNGVRQTSDFIGMPSDTLGRITESGSWFEGVVFGQYLLLFRECLNSSRFEGGTHVLVLSEEIAVKLILAGDISAVDIIISYFNTYIRAALNAGNGQLASNVVHHYQKVIVVAMEKYSASELWSTFVVKMCSYLKYYATVALERKVGSLAEAIAEMLCSLCIKATTIRFRLHDQILDIFLSIDDVAEKKDDDSTLVVIRRAQVRLAVKYLFFGNKDLAEKIAMDMQNEPLTNLERVSLELESR